MRRLRIAGGPVQLIMRLPAADAEPTGEQLWAGLPDDTPRAGAIAEALLFRALFDIGRDLNLTSQRLTAIGGLSAELWGRG